MDTPFVEIMRTRLRVENTPAFLEFVAQWKTKVSEIRTRLEGDPILGRRETWSAAMYTRRHIFASISFMVITTVCVVERIVTNRKNHARVNIAKTDVHSIMQ